jgi:GINS complex subunit 4
VVQTETVHLLRSDPDTSEDEHFRIMLVQTEVERVKFVIRSYVRTRLTKVSHVPCPTSSTTLFATKRLVVVHIFFIIITVITILISCTAGQIERFARWIVHNPDIQERLSQAELTHAQRFMI